MAKRKETKERGGAGAPLWCLSYGDMVTNMLCFFVMLLAFASFDPGEKSSSKNAAAALESAFVPTFSLNKDQSGSLSLAKGGKGILLIPNPSKMAPMPMIVRRVRNALQKVSLREQIQVVADDQNVKIRIPSKVLFLSGSAVLKSGSEEVLTALLPIISEVPNFIRIDGHSDDRPTKSVLYPTNWELSASRACSVVRYYVETHQQDAMRFSAQGFAEFQPRIDNLTEEDREQNRRVEIIILTSKPKVQSKFTWE